MSTYDTNYSEIENVTRINAETELRQRVIDAESAARQARQQAEILASRERAARGGK